jgi:hypothetical protein
MKIDIFATISRKYRMWELVPYRPRDVSVAQRAHRGCRKQLTVAPYSKKLVP